MAVMLIAGKGGFTGIPGDPLFGNPSPLNALLIHLVETGIDSRIDHMNYDDRPDPQRFAPKKPGEPCVLIGHSFGGELAVALAATMPRIAAKNDFPIGDISLVLLDPVMQAYWWTPLRPRFELPACVVRCMCWVRDALAFPFSSQISGENDEKRNFHRGNCSHNDIVEAADERVCQFVTGLFEAHAQ